MFRVGIPEIYFLHEMIKIYLVTNSCKIFTANINEVSVCKYLLGGIC